MKKFYKFFMFLILETLIQKGYAKMEASCPKYWKSPIGSEDCYKIHNYGTKRSFQEAEDYCERINSHLVSIETVEFKEWLLHQLGEWDGVGGGSVVWTGASKNENGDWVWIEEGDTIKTDVVDLIGVDNADNSCGSLNPKGQITRRKCSDEFHFVCHRSIYAKYNCDHDDDWEQHGDHCYKASSKRFSWGVGQIECSTMDANLIVINDKIENDFAQDKAYDAHSDIWIGLSEVDHAGNFTWIDQSVKNYTNWKNDTDDEQPVSMYGAAATVLLRGDSDGRWKTERVSEQNSYLCEKQTGACTTGWTELGDRCYFFNFEKSDKGVWRSAAAKCNAVGAQLVEIETVVENDFIQSNLPGDGYYWIGLYKKQQGEFMWNSGRDYDPGVFTQMTQHDYEEAMNNTDKEYCTYLKAKEGGGSIWIPGDCTEPSYYVCEASVDDEIKMPVPKADLYCPGENYVQNGEYCYKFYDTEATWEKAQSTCQQDGDGVNLASIVTWDESDFITDMITAEAWIGLNDRKADKHWEWVDGSQYRIQNWAPDEPNGPQESCVMLYLESGKWNDHFCDREMAFVCKRKASDTPIKPIPTTTPTPETECGYDWVENPQTGECYQFEDRTYTFSDAKAHCGEHHWGEEHRSTLVTINTPEEHDIIMDLLKKNKAGPNIWIGLTNDFEDGFGWIDGSAVTFMNWEEGQPDNIYLNDAIEMHTDSGLWNDADGAKRQKFICEKKGPKYVKPTIPPPPEPNCPKDWVRFRNHCYLYNANLENLDFDRAQKACQKKYNSNLLSILTEEENQWIYDTYKTTYHNMFIGLRQDDYGGAFKWVDDSVVDYTNWMDGEPNNAYNNEHCGEIMLDGWASDGEWNDINCAQPNEPYMCKMLVEICPVGYEYNSQFKKCYYVDKGMKSFQDGQKECQWAGAELLSIHSEEENLFAYRKMTEEMDGLMWFGLNDIDTKDWVWTDGTDVDYTNWAVNEPNYLDSEKCAHFEKADDKVAKWNNRKCSNMGGYSCGFTPTHAVGCEEDWYEYKGYCYFATAMHYDIMTRTFSEAQAYCADLGGNLASIHSIEENDFVVSVIGYSYSSLWIGITDSDKRGRFMWTDGSDVIFTKFQEVQASLLGSPNCAGIDSTNEWTLNNCEFYADFVCKKQAEPVPLHPPESDCNKGDVAYEGSCYNILSIPYDWNTAKEMCSSEGHHLIVVNDRFEQAFLSLHLGEVGNRAWIGMNLVHSDEDDSYNAQWVTGEEVTFTNWGHFEPRPEHGVCVEASGESDNPGLWYIMNCDSPRPSICEYDRKGYTPPTPPSTTPQPQFCPDDSWVRNKAEKSCYKTINIRSTFGHAESTCRSYGGHIMSWTNEDEQKFTNTIPNFNSSIQRMWLGFRQAEETQDYYWLDGTPMAYLPWENGQPDSQYEREQCGTVLIDSMKMAVYVCDDLLPYICEVKEGQMVTTIAPPTVVPDVKCPLNDSWLLYGDYCYHFVSEIMEPKASWWHSRRLCEAEGGSLASIHSYEENYWIISKIYSSSDTMYWLGAQANYDSAWDYWTDGTPFDFVNWKQGEPNNLHDQEDCIGMYAKIGGYWNDANCNKDYGRICKIPYKVSPPPVTSTTAPKGHCPEGWMHAGSRCIKLFGKEKYERKSFEDARTVCKKGGINGDLLSIHSAIQQASLLVLLGNWPADADVWIGMKYEDGFRWIDQTENDFINWAPGEPNNARQDNEDCVQVYQKNGYWNDAICGRELGFVCAVDPDPSIHDHHDLPYCGPPLDSYYRYKEDCYKFMTQSLTWKDAESKCKEEGSHLASALDHYQVSYLWVLGNANKAQDFYIGLNNIEQKNVFSWSDTSPVFIANWGKNEPNNTDTHNCVKVQTSDGLWQTTDCSEKKPFICKHLNKLVPTADPAVEGKCPNEMWMDFKGSHCYLFYKDRVASWGDANLQCIQDGGTLASIHSDTERDLILNSIKDQNDMFWIGLVYQQNDYAWTDRTVYDYATWKLGEPNSPSEKCVEMDTTQGEWNDKHCDSENRFVCKAKKLVHTTTTVPPQTFPSEPPTPGKADNSLSGGAITGIVFGVLLAFAAVGLIGYKFYTKPKSILGDNIFYQTKSKDPKTASSKVTVDNVNFGFTDA